MTLRSGARLGPYEVVGLLGAGGMGSLSRARSVNEMAVGARLFATVRVRRDRAGDL